MPVARVAAIEEQCLQLAQPNEIVVAEFLVGRIRCVMRVSHEAASTGSPASSNSNLAALNG